MESRRFLWLQAFFTSSFASAMVVAKVTVVPLMHFSAAFCIFVSSSMAVLPPDTTTSGNLERPCGKKSFEHDRMCVVIRSCVLCGDIV